MGKYKKRIKRYLNMQSIKEILDENEELRERLFPMGFYATTRKPCDIIANYPFYNLWKPYQVDEMFFYIHPRQHFYNYEKGKKKIVLIGHAYNPIKMLDCEDDILKELADKEDDSFFDELCSLTGIYTILWKVDKNWNVVGDASGMQTVYFGRINGGGVHLSAHANLLKDVLDLKIEQYVSKLSQYKFFKLFGNSLPGDLSPFREIKRVVPNHYVELGESCKSIRYHTPEICSNLSYGEIIDRASMILHNNIELIARKWSRPAISMTGGCDSKTTLACANGLYERFSYYSHISSEEESVDAEAAHEICKNGIGKEHSIYRISQEDADFSKIEEIRQIIDYNCGSLCPNNANDVRKRCFFANVNDFDVEVKSWASEIGRAYYSKRFRNRKKFGKNPTARKCTTLYKVFLHNRKLVRQTDKVFKQYLEKYALNSKTIPWQEQFFWEFRVPSWNGNVITGEHRYSYDITIPFNNCKLLELLLSVSLDDRITDKLYKDIRKKMNPKIDELGISVQNVKHTKRRAWMENWYYVIHSKLPF